MTHTKINFTKDRNINKGTHRVRLLLPEGMYPKKSILFEDSALYISDDICFSIAPNTIDEVSDDYYSEVEWATIPELRLYAATMLSVDREISYISLYPFNRSHFIDDPKLKITETTLLKIRTSLIEKINLPGRWSEKYQFMIQTGYEFFRNVKSPTACGGDTYTLREEGMQTDLLRQIYINFDVKDYLMIRGVSTLIRSAMLARDGFTEEAAILAFISLDASFNIILRRLKVGGMKNPSSEDAMQYIAETFKSEEEGKYFEYYHEQRIKTVHPESRFGVFPHAPLFADDYIHLFDNLLELYAFFICGNVNPKYIERYEQNSNLNYFK
jgi:hypothetical protein